MTTLAIVVKRYGSPMSNWPVPLKPASRTPASAEKSALAANVAVQTRAVGTSASFAARGFAPVAYRRRPTAVFASTTTITALSANQKTTTGGSGIGPVFFAGERKSARYDGAPPVSVAFVHASTAP